MRLRVIDIETTAGGPEAEIIEVGVVDVVADEHGVRAELPRTRLLRPLGEITVHAMAVHHLTPDDFPPDMPACNTDLLRELVWAGGRPDALVAHNASFERGYITPAVTDDVPWICTVKSAKRAWPEAPGFSNQVLRYWRGLRLDPALAMPPHRAGPDAWVTAHILIDLLAAASVEDMLAWTEAPRELHVVPFGKHRGKPWTAVPADYLRWMLTQADMNADVLTRARQEMEQRGLVEAPAA
ncbi:exonuclease domain-containing protein [Caulobacter sp. 17J80-11]|uniref:exonuclease domain-containing protein n=1 Tax=Caulobacter sp. 17J80-11 TaxID=2763502 RepID=UPI001653755C|nr:exonuclease domain-containing protein [Caulobacter sp. 17J80-11]MBC6980888.1 hypothetical protein [Caulobacter sp. 17J80-11]